MDFWLIFLLFFGWFAGSFRLLLLVVVLVCCFVGLLACWPVSLLARLSTGRLVRLLVALHRRPGGGYAAGN